MPIYEYRCRSCEHRFELLVRGSTTPVCPSCEGENAERLLSAFAVSSDSSRRSALQAARRANVPEARDKAVADYESFKHSHD